MCSTVLIMMSQFFYFFIVLLNHTSIAHIGVILFFPNAQVFIAVLSECCTVCSEEKLTCSCIFLQRELLATQRKHWEKVLLQALKDKKQILASNSQRTWSTCIYPYMCILDDQEYVNIMLQVPRSQT